MYLFIYIYMHLMQIIYIHTYEYYKYSYIWSMWFNIMVKRNILIVVNNNFLNAQSNVTVTGMHTVSREDDSSYYFTKCRGHKP